MIGEKRWLGVLILSLAAAGGCSQAAFLEPPRAETVEKPDVFGRAFDEKTSDLQVEGEGVVTRVLADDTEKPRHQRFVVELESGQSLLIVHNIDLAPRVAGIRKGDRVEFSGEYEWDEKGGVVHWTHQDPAGRHDDGWIRHAERKYE